MSRYIIKRLLMAAFTLFVIMFVSYVLLRKAPGDPTRSSFFGDASSASSQGLSVDKGLPIQNKSMRQKLHLDDPVYVGFALWLKDMLFGFDLGESVSVEKGRPVGKVILEKLPVTVKLNLMAILLTYLLAIPVGIHSAVSRDSRLEKGITFFLFFLYSIPGFWLALLLQATLCEGGKIPLFPLKGIGGDPTWGKGTWQIIFDSMKYYVIPVFCLSYAGFAGLSRYARAGMLDVIRQDYIRTARAKGLSEFAVIMKHAFSNAVITLITLFAELLPGLIAGSIILEYIFNIPGMGWLSMQALSSRDIPLLMAIFGFGSALTLLGILVADLLYIVADPRIRLDR